MAQETSLVTRVAQRALEWQERLEKRIDKEFAASIGYETVSVKKTRLLMRAALGMGGEETEEEIRTALLQLQQLHQTNQRPDGRNPVEEEANLILAQYKTKRRAEVGSIMDIAGDGEGKGGLSEGGLMSAAARPEGGAA